MIPSTRPNRYAGTICWRSAPQGTFQVETAKANSPYARTAVTRFGARPVSSIARAATKFAENMTQPRPIRATIAGATSDPISAPTPMPAVTKPIAAGATPCSSRK